MEDKKIKQPKMTDGSFYVNESKRVVVYCKICHDKKFYGIAKCSEQDLFSTWTGQALAKLRAELAMVEFQIKATSTTIFTFNRLHNCCCTMDERLCRQLLGIAYKKLCYLKQKRISLRKRIKEIAK